MRSWLVVGSGWIAVSGWDTGIYGSGLLNYDYVFEIPSNIVTWGDGTCNLLQIDTAKRIHVLQNILSFQWRVATYFDIILLSKNSYPWISPRLNLRTLYLPSYRWINLVNSTLKVQCLPVFVFLGFNDHIFQQFETKKTELATAACVVTCHCTCLVFTDWVFFQGRFGML